MAKAKRKQGVPAFPQAKIVFTQEEYLRFARGPLAATAGRGLATYGKAAMIEKLEAWERVNQ